MMPNVLLYSLSKHYWAPVLVQLVLLSSWQTSLQTVLFTGKRETALLKKASVFELTHYKINIKRATI